MLATIRYGLLLLFLFCLAACTSSPIRIPAAKKSVYNQEKIRLLHLASDNGILFQIPDAVLKDVPQKSIGERCRKSFESAWPEKVFSTLQVFQQNPAYLQKVHVIEFKRGDESKAEISKDLDNAASLVIYYSKKEVRERINSLSEIPCANGDMDMIGRDMSATVFEWPSSAAIASALLNAPDRANVERFNFDRRFVSWLADRVTVFRLTADAAFEKAPTGQPLLPNAMTVFSNQLSAPGETAAVDYWLSEINQRSNIGEKIKFFGFKRDSQLSTGVQVDAGDHFSRKMNGSSGVTYPYASYRLESNAYTVTKLSELNACLTALTGLTGTLRSALSMGSFDTDADSFLHPGHHCNAKKP